MPRPPISFDTAMFALGEELKRRLENEPSLTTSSRHELGSFINHNAPESTHHAQDWLILHFEDVFGVSAELHVDAKPRRGPSPDTYQIVIRVSWPAVGAQTISHGLAQVALFRKVLELAATIEAFVDQFPEIRGVQV